MSAALLDWIEPSDGFDPLAPTFMGRFVASLDYDTRRELTARGGGRRAERRLARAERQVAKLRAQLAAERQAKAALRSQLRSAATHARRSGRALAKQRAELAYAQRFKTRAAQKRIREQAREIERLARYEQREAAKTGRALRAFFTPASRRSSYQRRVISGVSRQIERGEQPSIAGALGRKTIAARLQEHAVKLDRYYGKPGPASTIENAGDAFRSLPLDVQISILKENDALNREYIEGGRRKLGRDWSPFFAYH
jgi:hypothetical protein